MAMDNINNQINSALTTLRQGESGRQSQGTGRPEVSSIEALWGLMASMYGHKWVSSYGEEVDPDKVWAACLKGISPDQIKHGLNQCAVRGLDWPPSAPEFRALCIDDEGREWRAFQAQARETAKALEDNRLRLADLGKQERAKAARDAHAKTLKSMFNGTGN